MIFIGLPLQCHMAWENQGSSLLLPLPQPCSLGLTQSSLSMPSLSPRFLALVSVDMENQVLHSGEPREDMKALRFKSLASSFCAFNGSDLAGICRQVLLGQSLGSKLHFTEADPELQGLLNDSRNWIIQTAANMTKLHKLNRFCEYLPGSQR